MTAAAEQTWQGWWWRADRPDERWSGTLVFSPDGGARLDAYAEWPQGGAARPPEREQPWAAVIHGDSVDGRKLTLLRCPLWGGAPYGPGRMVMEWRPQTIVVGNRHFAGRDEMTADTVRLEMDGLLEWLREPWCGPGLFGDSWPWRKLPRPRARAFVHRRSRAARALARDRRRRRIHNAQHARELRAQRAAPGVFEPVTVRVGDAAMRLGADERRGFSWLLGDRVELVASVRITLDSPITLKAWRERWIEPLNRFLILAAAGPVAIETMRFEARDDPVGTGFEILEQRSPAREAPSGRGSHFMPLPRAAAGRHLERLLGNWYRLHRELDPALTLFLGTLVGRQWLDNQLLNLMSFIEAHHERLHNRLPVDLDEFRRERKRILKTLSGPMRETFAQKLGYAERLPQQDRLEDMIERALAVAPELEPFADDLLRQAAATRNHLAHLGKPGPNVVTDDQALARMTNRLVAVAYANLLRDLGLDDEAAHHALARRYAQSPVLDERYEVDLDDA